VPQAADALLAAQRLQFADRTRSEQLLLSFVRETFALDVARVEIRPSSVSLNSVNGRLILGDGVRLFFKTHTDDDGVIDEYYNAVTLKNAGYPVLQPVLKSTVAGRQFLVYEMIDDPTLFDVAWQIERSTMDFSPDLTRAQGTLDRQLQDIYRSTLQWQSAEEAACAPIHQLFFHRLAGGRADRFLSNIRVLDMGERSVPFPELREARWSINGQRYHETIDSLIETAKEVLHPKQAGPSVVGHGDAHNGNIFFCGSAEEMLYFDPAFAGRHNPFLDIAKPLYHNVFAMWMYFPGVKHHETTMKIVYRSGVLEVDHDYVLHPVREAFLQSKISNVVIPLVRELDARSWLQGNWRRYLKSALLCCPLLTVDLADEAKFPPAMTVLGLASAIEMGADSLGRRSLVDQVLDLVEASIR
jgi:hypothetical protein